MKHRAMLLAWALALLLAIPAGADEGGRFSIDLAERHDIRFLGEDEEDEMGVQVRFGDLDGDGYDDVILGAWLADGPRNQRARCGEVYVYFGGVVEKKGAASLGASVIYGAEAKSRIGSAADTGDYDGDGVTDLLIGARYSDGPADSLRLRSGEAFLLLGGSDGSAKRVVDLRRHPDAVIVGRFEGDRLGRRIVVEDLDRDGKDDLLVAAVGSAGRDTERRDAGAVYVIYGSRRADLEGRLDLSLAETPALHGADESDALGNAMTVGDWNGDDLPDLFLGCGFADGPANGRTNGGEVFVLFGDGLRFQGERVVEEGTDFTIYGAEPYDGAGIAIAAGDFDGDGLDDIAVGASLGDGPDNSRDNCGEVYLLFGGTGTRPGDSIDLAAGADITFFGVAPGDQLGSVLHLFDWNGDGYQDLIVSSLLHDGPGGRRVDAGMVYATLGGRQSALRPFIDYAGEEANLMLLGPTRGDKIATLLEDGLIDGAARLIAGTMLGDGPNDERRDSGEIYLLPWKPGAED
ncbi:MAG: hypothetical protein ABIK65_09140 [Candidatus Eisenbacteria bacterium]